MVHKEFEATILNNQLFNKQQSLLLAISGGVDSVVLAYLLKKCGYNFSFAHCNFQLRDSDSDADEDFCKALAIKLDVKFYSQTFDVIAYCKKNKVSIQMAARELRYSWFNTLCETNQFKYLITAHHLNDEIETFFINLCRGTGINGLNGISQKKGLIVRPLINFTKEEIISYAKKEKIKYRTDKSNLESKYERNFFRLKIIPQIKKLHPNFEQTLSNTLNILKEESEILNDFILKKTKLLVTKNENLLSVNKFKLKKEKYLKTILHHIIHPFGFNKTQLKNIEINLLNDGDSGKLFNSNSHELIIDRDYIYIRPKHGTTLFYNRLNSLDDINNTSFLSMEELINFKLPAKNELIIEYDKLIFPIIIRSKKIGDKFIPFGMTGFRLISDFLKDEKLNAFEKEKCLLMENGNGDIIWVIGYRSDNRYRILNKKAKLLKIKSVEQK